MSWDIRVWHDDVDDGVRLIIQAGSQVPDEVISAVASSYWFEEVQFGGDDWEESDYVEEPEGGPSGLHG